MGLWGFPFLRAVSGGAHGLTDWDVEQHAGLARAGRERDRSIKIIVGSVYDYIPTVGGRADLGIFVVCACDVLFLCGPPKWR